MLFLVAYSWRQDEGEIDEIMEIVKIEPGSRTMEYRLGVINAYNLDVGLLPSSVPAMIPELKQVIADESTDRCQPLGARNGYSVIMN